MKRVKVGPELGPALPKLILFPTSKDWPLSRFTETFPPLIPYVATSAISYVKSFISRCHNNKKPDKNLPGQVLHSDTQQVKNFILVHNYSRINGFVLINIFSEMSSISKPVTLLSRYLLGLRSPVINVAQRKISRWVSQIKICLLTS